MSTVAIFEKKNIVKVRFDDDKPLANAGFLPVYRRGHRIPRWPPSCLNL